MSFRYLPAANDLYMRWMSAGNVLFWKLLTETYGNFLVMANMEVIQI